MRKNVSLCLLSSQGTHYGIMKEPVCPTDLNLKMKDAVAD